MELFSYLTSQARVYKTARKRAEKVWSDSIAALGPEERDPRYYEDKYIRRALSNLVYQELTNLPAKEHGIYVNLSDDQKKMAGMFAEAAYLWTEGGGQTVEMPKTFGAALLVSSITEELATSARPPWDFFVIDVPGNLIRCRNDERVGYIHKIFVMCGYDGGGGFNFDRHANGYEDGAEVVWSFVAASNDGEVGLQMYCAADLVEDAKGNISSFAEVENNRACMLVSRLILTTCAAMSMPGKLEKKPCGPRSAGKRRGRNNEPVPITTTPYVLGAPIAVDFSDRVREFSETGSFSGRGGKLEVRTLVRGHFKRVYHGEGWTLCKTVWIQPYWKGPEEAAIVVRPHVLKAS